MSPMLWSVGILAVAIAGILGLRTLSDRVRIAFDIVCLIALCVVFYQQGATPFSHLPAGSPDAGAIAFRAAAVAWWILSARVVVAILYFALRHDRRSRKGKLFVDLLAAATYIGTALIVLESVLALPVTGLVATSGVVAIVLGLALQSTLSDVFSGIAIGIEAPFQVGDQISLGDLTEGNVVEMNWRAIRVQTDGADIATIPNSIAAKLEIINRSVPSRRRAVSVEVWCPTSALSERVIDTLQQATLLCPTILESPASGVTLTRAGPAWACYTIAFSVADTQFVDTTKSLLLCHARRQLYHAGLLADGAQRRVRYSATAPAFLPLRRILRELTLFECLQPPQLEELAIHIRTRLIEPGDILFRQGASDATLYIVASGILEMTQDIETGAEATLGNLGAGEYVGEISLLTGAPHAATARARTHCYIHHVPREAIEPLISAHAELAAAFDKSVRLGLDLLHRSVAARATPNPGSKSQLLQRIREFFSFTTERSARPE